MLQLAHAAKIPNATLMNTVHQPGIRFIITPKNPIFEMLLGVKFSQSAKNNHIAGTNQPSIILIMRIKGLNLNLSKKGSASTSLTTAILPSRRAVVNPPGIEKLVNNSKNSSNLKS